MHLSPEVDGLWRTSNTVALLFNLPPLVFEAGALKWLCSLHYNIGVPEQALGWLPLGLGLGWLLKINLMSFHVYSYGCFAVSVYYTAII